jgi:hypothetical protein
LFTAAAVTAGRTPDGLASWSEAAVCDRLFGLCSGVFADGARQATRLQWLCWRAHLAQLSVHGRAARQALTRVLSEARLDVGVIDRADAAVVDGITTRLVQAPRGSP